MNRLTLIQSVVSQALGRTDSFEARYSRLLEAPTQPYYRQLIAPTKAEKVQFGWISPNDVGLIFIRNDEGGFHDRVPTDQEREAIKHLELCIFYDSPNKGFSIRPGECFIATPTYPDLLQIQAMTQPVAYTLVVFPR